MFALAHERACFTCRWVQILLRTSYTLSRDRSETKTYCRTRHRVKDVRYHMNIANNIFVFRCSASNNDLFYIYMLILFPLYHSTIIEMNEILISDCIQKYIYLFTRSLNPKHCLVCVSPSDICSLEAALKRTAPSGL